MTTFTIPPVNDVPPEVLEELRLLCKDIMKSLGWEINGWWAHLGDGDDTPALHLPNGLLSIDQCFQILVGAGFKHEKIMGVGFMMKDETKEAVIFDTYDLPSIIRATHKAVSHD